MCCMLAGAVTKDFGVLACDSAMYNTESGKMSFDTFRMMASKSGKLAFSFIGTYLYLANLDKEKMAQPFDAACIYLKDYLRSQKESVAEQMKAGIADEDENKPNFCALALGMHSGHPVIAQFNSFNDFAPRYIWTDDKIRFASIIYGDDSNPEKQAMFKESTEYMEMKAGQYPEMTQGIVGEILTRGIYKKADLEMNIGMKKKYAGGVVNVVSLSRETGQIQSLSNFMVI